jgi:hypothetical protein
VHEQKEKEMKKPKIYLAFSAVAVISAAVIGSVFAQPLWAQVKAALVRDIDTPALAPFRGTISFTLPALNGNGGLLTTVPAGKRLVIEHVSYSAGLPTGQQVVYAALTAGSTTAHVLQINVPHASVNPNFVIQDASQPLKAYFEAGDQVGVTMSQTGSVGNVSLYATGYYVTP